MTCNGRVALRMGESASVGEVLTLVQRLQAAADLVSMAANPDDSIEVTVETPYEVPTFLEKLQGIDSAQQVDDDPRGTPTYKVTLEDLPSASSRWTNPKLRARYLHRFVQGLRVAVHQ